MIANSAFRIRVATLAVAATFFSASAAQADIALTPVGYEGVAKAADEATEAPAPATDACATPKKKKKGLGLGGIMKAAKSSGLGNVLSGGLGGIGGSGRGGQLLGSIASTAINAGASAAANSAAKSAAQPQPEC